jgi:hypothetical protein
VDVKRCHTFVVLRGRGPRSILVVSLLITLQHHIRYAADNTLENHQTTLASVSDAGVVITHAPPLSAAEARHINEEVQALRVRPRSLTSPPEHTSEARDVSQFWTGNSGSVSQVVVAHRDRLVSAC